MDPNKQLERECRAFSLYLAGVEPSHYLREKYADCHARVAALSEGTAFDRLLVKIAAGGPWRARFADSYAVRLHRTGMLRKKLVAMLALLECAPEAFESLEAPRVPGRARGWARLIGTVAISGVLAVVSIAVLWPVEAGMKLARAGRRERPDQCAQSSS